jgi:hypothetical protein
LGVDPSSKNGPTQIHMSYVSPCDAAIIWFRLSMRAPNCPRTGPTAIILSDLKALVRVIASAVCLFSNVATNKYQAICLERGVLFDP